MTVAPLAPQRLPVPSRYFAGESLNSYNRRLSSANTTTVADIERALKSAGHTISAGRHAEDRKALWRILGGLPPSAFTTPTELDGEEVVERQLCLQCCSGHMARGRLPTVGHICLRHKRWFTDAVQVSVEGMPELLAAERVFRRVLSPRRVLVDNHAYLLAQECSTAAIPRSVLNDRASARSAVPVEALAYPETVGLARLLTDSAFLGEVLHTRAAEDRFGVVETAVSSLLPYSEVQRAVGRLWDVVKVLYARAGRASSSDGDLRDPWNLLRHW